MAIVTQLRKHLRAAWTWIAQPVHQHACQTCMSAWECQDSTCQLDTVVPVCEGCERAAEKALAMESVKQMRADLRQMLAQRRSAALSSNVISGRWGNC